MINKILFTFSSKPFLNIQTIIKTQPTNRYSLLKASLPHKNILDYGRVPEKLQIYFDTHEDYALFINQTYQSLSQMETIKPQRDIYTLIETFLICSQLSNQSFPVQEQLLYEYLSQIPLKKAILIQSLKLACRSDKSHEFNALKEQKVQSLLTLSLFKLVDFHELTSQEATIILQGLKNANLLLKCQKLDVVKKLTQVCLEGLRQKTWKNLAMTIRICYSDKAIHECVDTIPKIVGSPNPTEIATILNQFTWTTNPKEYQGIGKELINRMTKNVDTRDIFMIIWACYRLEITSVQLYELGNSKLQSASIQDKLQFFVACQMYIQNQQEFYEVNLKKVLNQLSPQQLGLLLQANLPMKLEDIDDNQIQQENIVKCIELFGNNEKIIKKAMKMIEHNQLDLVSLFELCKIMPELKEQIQTSLDKNLEENELHQYDGKLKEVSQLCLELNNGSKFLQRISQYFWDRIDDYENRKGMGNLIYLCYKFDLKIEVSNLEKKLSELDRIELGNLGKVIKEKWIEDVLQKNDNQFNKQQKKLQ